MANKTNLKTFVVMAVILLVFGCTIAAGDVIYVDADASPGGDGTSWEDAYKYLQDALAVAGGDDQIWVAEGTYKPDQGGRETPGDLDAFVVNSDQGNKVWLNEGKGKFSDSSQSLGSASSQDVELGDVDGEGDLDAFVANYSQPNKVWLKNGHGKFSDSGQSLGNS